MTARDDAVKAAAEALYRGGLDRDAADEVERLRADLPDPTSGDLDETVPVVTVDDVFGPGWLAQHLAQIDHGSRLRFADPDREARYRATATCVPAGCSCDCHRWPGVSHLVACCSQPPFAPANPTTTEADA